MHQSREGKILSNSSCAAGTCGQRGDSIPSDGLLPYGLSVATPTTQVPWARLDSNSTIQPILAVGGQATPQEVWADQPGWGPFGGNPPTDEELGRAPKGTGKTYDWMGGGRRPTDWIPADPRGWVEDVPETPEQRERRETWERSCEGSSVHGSGETEQFYPVLKSFGEVLGDFKALMDGSGTLGNSPNANALMAILNRLIGTGWWGIGGVLGGAWIMRKIQDLMWAQLEAMYKRVSSNFTSDLEKWICAQEAGKVVAPLCLIRPCFSGFPICIPGPMNCFGLEAISDVKHDSGVGITDLDPYWVDHYARYKFRVTATCMCFSMIGPPSVR